MPIFPEQRIISPMTKRERQILLEPGEAERDRWVAGIPAGRGRRVKVGGTLVLTDRRLLFRPLGAVFTTDPVGGVPIDVTSGEARALALSDIEGVERDADRPALLRITLRDGETVEYLVAHGRFTPAWSKKNEAACERAVAVLDRALHAPNV